MSLRNKFDFEKEPIYVMDGNAFVFRGYYANLRMARSDSFPTGAIYVVGRILMKILREEMPKYFVFVLDGHGKHFRHEIYPEYKANRPPAPADLVIQFEPIRQLLSRLGIRVEVSKNGEADDCIASLAKRYSKERPVVIVGTDKDLRQCLNKNVILWDPAAKEEKIVTEESFRSDTGLAPSQWADIQALIGDSADNIPGVPGVGEKTAMKLFQEFPNLESIRENYDNLSPSIKKKMEGNLEKMFLFRKLTTLSTQMCQDVSLEDMLLQHVNEAQSLAFFQEFELNSLARDFQTLARKNLIHVSENIEKHETLDSEPNDKAIKTHASIATESAKNLSQESETYATTEDSQRSGDITHDYRLVSFREKPVPSQSSHSGIKKEQGASTISMQTDKEQNFASHNQEISSKDDLENSTIKYAASDDIGYEVAITQAPLFEVYHVENLPSCLGKVLGVYEDEGVHLAFLDMPEPLQKLTLFQERKNTINKKQELEKKNIITEDYLQNQIQKQDDKQRTSSSVALKNTKKKGKNTQQSLLGLMEEPLLISVPTKAKEKDAIAKVFNAGNFLKNDLKNRQDIVYKGNFEDLIPYMQDALQIVFCDVKKALHTYPKLVDSFYDYTQFFDLGVGAWLLSPDEKEYSFNSLVRQYTQNVMKEAREKTQMKTLPATNLGNSENTAHKDLASESLQRFSSLHKAHTVLELYTKMLDDLHERSLLKLLFEMEMPLIPVLYSIEKEGIQVNVGALFTFLEDVRLELDRLTKEIYGIAGGEFNIRSAQQIGEVLFKKLSLPMTKSTKGGQASTSQEVLEKLSGAHPIIDALQEFRKLEKLRSTYLEPLPRMTGNDGRIRTTLNQCATATGRLSSSNPNLQNIPVRGELGKRMRSCFTAKPEFSLVSADYSQVELRVLAHCSGDETLRTAFLNNEDIHARTAALLYSVDMDKVDADMRRHAKTINFGLLYGMGSRKLAQDLHISTQEAKRFMEVYFARFTRIKAFYDEVENFAREHAYVITLAGRQRALPNILSVRGQEKALAERQAVNTMIQGTAADIIKLAMLAVDHDSLLKELGAKLLLQIHDELILEVPSKNASRAGKRMAEIMMNIAPSNKRLSVPLLVDYGVGENWEGAH